MISFSQSGQMSPRAANTVRLNAPHHYSSRLFIYAPHGLRGDVHLELLIPFGVTRSVHVRHIARWFFCSLIISIPFLSKWGLGNQISVRVENSTLTTADAVELRMQLTTTRLCFTGEYIFIIFGVRALFFAFVAALRWFLVFVGFVLLAFLVALVSLGLSVGVFAYSAGLLALLLSTTASRAIPVVLVLGPTSQ